jgi:hypothetical protein
VDKGSAACSSSALFITHTTHTSLTSPPPCHPIASSSSVAVAISPLSSSSLDAIALSHSSRAPQSSFAFALARRAAITSPPTARLNSPSSTPANHRTAQFDIEHGLTVDPTCAGYCFRTWSHQPRRVTFKHTAPVPRRACSQPCPLQLQQQKSFRPPHHLRTKSQSYHIPQRCIHRQSNSLASAPNQRQLLQRTHFSNFIICYLASLVCFDTAA